MEWETTRFPGCEVKTLLMDPRRLMTALMQFAPGAALPDHEHVNIEQTYVLEGQLVDKEGPAAGHRGQDGRVRLARARQPAFGLVARRAALMLAMFQVPNKFFEATAASPMPAGQDLGPVWKDVLPAKVFAPRVGHAARARGARSLRADVAEW